MSLGQKTAKGAALVTAARLSAYGLGFLRNLMLARMLTKADFGLASLIVVTLTMLDFTSRMSLRQQVIQSKIGDSTVFLSTCHAMQALLGAASALLLMVLAAPVAALCNVPEATWAFMMMALAPLGLGLQHLDNQVKQRRLEYGPSVLVDVVPQVVITAAAWPLALWLGDFRVTLVLELVRIALMVGMTHWIAETPYRWHWEKEHLRSIFSFGWPLILSGMFLTLSQQADRMVIGHYYSMSELAEYSLAFSVTTVPFLIFAQVASSTMLPVLSRSQDDRGVFVRQYRVCLECAALLAVCVIAPLMALSDRLIPLLYGAKYTGAGVIVMILGASTAFRLLRVATGVAAMAVGDTKNQLVSNVGRSVGLLLALAVAVAGQSVLMVACAAIGGEFIALAVSLGHLHKKQQIRAGMGLRAAMFIALGCLASAAVDLLLPASIGLLAAAAVTAVLMLAVASLSAAVFPETSRLLWRNLVLFVSRRNEPAGAVA